MKIQNTFLLQFVFSPLKFFLFLILTISLLYTSAYSAEVTLQWDPNTESDLAGYKIYYDTNSGAPYEGNASDQGESPIVVAIEDLSDENQPQYTITGLEGSRDYFFAVTAYDNETPSLESAYSDEATVSTYTIGSSAGQNGSISPAGSVSATNGSSRTFTVTPDAGYHIANVLVDGSSVGAVSSYTFNSITADHSIIAIFAINSYTITASAGLNGTVSPSGSVSATNGSSRTFTVTPNAGYHIANVLVDGSSVGAVSAYTFTNITANHTISASFAINSYTITASAGSNGAVSPSGSVSATNGSSRTFTVTPDAGYHIANVLVDGSSVGAVSSYTFNSITANHSIIAIFAINSYTITASAGSNGAVSPSGSVSATNGSSRTFTVTPDAGYHIANVLVDGSSVGAVSSYTFTNITANHTISASFAINSYTIAASAGSNGVISPSGSISVANGENRTFSVTPNAGYHIINVLVDGSSVGAVSAYTFTNITANHTISASFAINSYTITASAGSNGAVSPSGSVSATNGSSRTFTVTPNADYHIANVLVDGSSVGTVSSYTFTDITRNHTIFIDFQADNQPPVANAGPDQLVDEKSIVTLSGLNSSDPDDGIAKFSWIQTQGTPVVLSNPTEEETTFTAPDVSPAGETLVFQLTVEDYSGAQTSDTCIINVSWVNIPPTADAGPDQAANEGGTVVLNGSYSFDGDDGIASYQWAQIYGTPVTLSDPTSDQPTFQAPDTGVDGESLRFHLTVIDNGGLQAQDVCIVNVLMLNEPPVADAGPDQEVEEGDTVILNGEYSTDPDDGIFSYQWVQLSGTPVAFSDPGSPITDFTAPEALTDTDFLTFELTVTDHGGLKNTASCIVGIKPIVEETDLTSPEISIEVPNSGTNYVTKSRYITLSGYASDDVSVTKVTWKSSRGYSGTASGTENWEASRIKIKPKSNIITVTAADAAGNQTSTTINVYRRSK